MKLPRFGLLARVVNRFRYPGLRVASGVVLDVEGWLGYESGASIGEGSNVIVGPGATLNLGQGSYVGRYAEICPGGTVDIGEDTSVQDRCILLGDIHLGRYCRLAPNVMISSGRHYFDLRPSLLIRDQDALVTNSTELSAQHSRAVTVEDDCWIGVNSVIMPGVTVGKGAVVGAGSVVVRDVEPYTVVAGTPAREVRKRLHFLPPHRVSAEREGDWPYFYSGFELRVDRIGLRDPETGLAARGAFRLCLDTGAANSVHLVVRAVGTSDCFLSHGSTKRFLGDEFGEVSFPLDPCQPAGRGLLFVPSIAGALIRVREAWVE